jgi:hypothetical protein
MPMSTCCGLPRATSSTARVRSLVASSAMAMDEITTALPDAGLFSGIPRYQAISFS